MIGTLMIYKMKTVEIKLHSVTTTCSQKISPQHFFLLQKMIKNRNKYEECTLGSHPTATIRNFYGLIFTSPFVLPILSNGTTHLTAYISNYYLCFFYTEIFYATDIFVLDLTMIYKFSLISFESLI